MPHQIKERVVATKEQMETNNTIQGDETIRTEAEINSLSNIRSVTLQDPMRV